MLSTSSSDDEMNRRSRMEMSSFIPGWHAIEGPTTGSIARFASTLTTCQPQVRDLALLSKETDNKRNLEKEIFSVRNLTSERQSQMKRNHYLSTEIISS